LWLDEQERNIFVDTSVTFLNNDRDNLELADLGGA